ncbi:MAG: tetratricopeptide repeat protein [Desulfobacteraceae bacterium]|nr:tetratricopeptide repeat protein [Desulfobacteraceae bacterium]
MTHQKTRLFHNRSSIKEFLLYKTDANPKKDTPEVLSSVVTNRILKAFPDIPVGKTFIENAMARFETIEKFESMVIKIDSLNHEGSETAGNDQIDLWLNVANVIDTICRRENGMWGRLDQGMLGCFFSPTNQTSPLEFAQKIKKILAEFTNETISIGIASYPTLSFTRSQIIDNAGKALIHAAFFGPDSIVSFDAVSLNISGDNLYQNGDIDGAIEEFKTALLLDPSDINIHNSLGVCYGILGDYGKALKEFQAALKLDPDEVMALYNIGLVKMLTGKNSEALKYFLDADKKKEEDIFEVAFQIGRVYLDMGKSEMAKEFLEKAVKLNPESWSALHSLGECCTALNMTDEAISAYKKAIRQNPNDAESLSAIGYLFDLLGENPEITTIFCQQSIDIAPENGLYRYRLGSLYLKRNQLEEALIQFQKAHDLGYDARKMIKKIKKLIKDA